MAVCTLQVVCGNTLGEVARKVIHNVRFPLLDLDKLGEVEAENRIKAYIPVRRKEEREGGEREGGGGREGGREEGGEREGGGRREGGRRGERGRKEGGERGERGRERGREGGRRGERGGEREGGGGREGRGGGGRVGGGGREGGKIRRRERGLSICIMS